MSTDPKATEKQQSKVAAPANVDEEDEFPEFPVRESTLKADDDQVTDVNVWEDNWDDETVETDFSKQLREELKKHGYIGGNSSS